MDTTFSIIMPAYNAALFIEESIRSVLCQTYANFELIIVNDGSTDNTNDIISTFKDDRIKVIQQLNKGLGAARNAGIENSVNEYIAFLDSDDIWRNDKLQNVISGLDGPDVGLYYSNVMEFKTDIASAIPNRYSEPIKPMATKDLILIYDFVVVSSSVVPSNIMKEYGGFSEDLYGTEDWDLWIRIGQKYKFKKIEEYDCYYRINENGLSKKREEFLKKEFQVIHKHLLVSGLGSIRVRELALWVWYKKNFYYYLSNLKLVMSFRFFLKMLRSNPLEPANFDFLTRAFKKINI